MYKLKKGDVVAVTDKEYKRDLFLEHGFTLIKEPKKRPEKEREEKDE